MKKVFSFSFVGALVALAAVSARAESFTGVTSSDPTVGSNYSGGTAPTFGGTAADNGVFSVQNQGNNPFVYSASLGTTVFNAYTYTSGTTNGSGLGTLNVTGGSLSFGGNNGGNGSQNVLGDGLVNVSGGMLSFLNGNTGDNSSLWVGNNSGNGTINVSTGSLTTQNGIIFGRQGSTGILNLTGGTVTIQGTAGSFVGSASGNTGTGIINLSAGVYQQTGSGAITFNTGSYVNFSLNSTAQLSLNGATVSSLQTLVSSGDIYKNGAADTNTADYRYTVSGAQGILSLAVPEPSTWAAAVAFLALFAFSLRRRLVGSV